MEGLLVTDCVMGAESFSLAVARPQEAASAEFECSVCEEYPTRKDDHQSFPGGWGLRLRKKKKR